MSGTYNGWKNYETWLVNIWVTNDEGWNEYWQEAATDAASVSSLADALESEITDQAREQVGNNGLLSDLLRAALREVDWREIAESFWNVAHENDSDDDGDDDDDDGGAA